MNLVALLSVLFCASITEAQVYNSREPLVHTFSIVARDSATGEMAVAVQSHWFSVGTAVSWGEAGVGVVATQSFVDKSYGPKALALIKQGLTAGEALDSLKHADPGVDVRQVAIIDYRGNVAAHTGTKCIQYASHITGNDFSVQSNMMLGPKVCESMAAAFRQSTGKPLPERLLLALEAAQKAGGDIRGMQSAAMIVVPGTPNNQPWNDKLVDLRVDDHTQPIKELKRLYSVHVAYQHMNNGDLAVEKNDMELAMREYNAAMKMFPANLEMQFWTAVTLANTGNTEKAIPMFRKIFAKDNNWKELAKRLPAVGLLKLESADLKLVIN
ncbi:MAG TPA: DUF1028 domain-containing protein [Chitinophagaceae bacterium]